MFAKRMLVLFALLVLWMSVVVWGTAAQETPNEVLPERLEMLVYPPTEENSAQLVAVLAQMAQPDTAATSAAPNFHLPATLLVYQNFDTGNWEILKNTASTAKINLSNSPAADIHPRLNRGATHIIFASNRTGNFDLFMMKADGSNVVQLTNSAGDDVNPVWSPDGTKIAFESYRDGQAEIYVMNVDGSNQTRLTNSGDFDGMPTWSPDGQMLAFSSRRTGGYRIYTMDAATGANQIQRSNYPYSLSPAWSPDGESIYFSATYQNAGEIWLSGYHLKRGENGTFYESGTSINNYHFSSTSDVWIRGWTPTIYPRVVFDVRYYINVGSYPHGYQLEKTEIWASYKFNSNNPDNYQAFNTNDFLSINPDVNTLDITPPIVQMNPLPVMPASAAVVPHWSYIETGSGAGLTQFQYKFGNGEWINWYDNALGPITAISFNQPVTIGQPVYFRAQNLDQNRNQGTWSEPSSATFYNWYLSGELRDNRGQAVANIPVTFSKSVLNEVKTDGLGHYTAQTAEAGSYQISVGEQVIPTTLSRETRSHLPYAYLAPADNLLANGHFETNFDQWQNEAGTAVIRAGFTGESAISLGEPFATCTNCVKNLHTFSWYDDFYLVGYGQLILDKLGNVHLLFMARQTVNSPGKIYHTFINPQGVWSPVQPTTITGSSIHWIGTSDEQGNLYIVYNNNSNNTTTHYVRYDAITGWSPVELIPINIFVGTSYVFIDNYGAVHFINYHEKYYLKRATNGVWAEQSLPTTNTNHGITQLKNGEIHLFSPSATQYTGEIGGGIYVIYHYVYQSNGTWQKIGELFPKQAPNIHWLQATFVPSEEMWYVDTNRYQNEEGWVQFTAPYGLTADMVQVYFTGTQIGVSLREPYRYSTETILLEEEDEYVINGLLDPQQMLHYVTNDMQYYGREGRTALHDETHTLAQVVTIPADMPNPTVSLMYRTIRDLPGDDTQFEVQITNGALTTTHVLSPTAVVWEHAWFDASEWAGETVTLTLAAVQKAGDPLLRVDLDDVSLGSAAPDTWIALDIPQTAVPSEEITLTLHYGNFSPDLLAPTTTVTLTLPAGLTIHSISVTPTVQTAAQIIWQLGDLPADTSGTIALTATVNGNVPLMSTLTSTAELRTTIPEPSWSNNSTTAALFIGHRVHLPAVFK